MLLSRASASDDGDWQDGIGTLFVSAWMSSALSGMLVGQLNFHSWLVTVPFAWAFFFFPAIFLFARMTHWSVRQTMAAWLPWVLCLAWMAPLLEWVGRWIGFGWFAKDNLVLREVPLAWLTLGWLPHPIASFGSTGVLSVSAIFAGWRVARITRRPWRGLLLSVCLVAVWGCILVFPSVLAWIGRPAGQSMATLYAADVSRSAVLLSMDGYWWQNAHARFFSGVRSEAELSVALLEGAMLFLGVAWFSLGWIWKKRKEAFAITPALFRPVFFLAWGVAFAFLQGTHLDTRFVSLMAWLTALTTALLFLASSFLYRQDRKASAWVFALCFSGAWLLGLPIFLFTAVAVALLILDAYGLGFDRSKRWTMSAFAGCSVVIAVAIAWLFLTRQADLSRFPVAIALALLTGVGGFHMAQMTKRWQPMVGGYLAAGLFFGSRLSFLFSLLVSLVSMFVWHRPSNHAWERSFWFYLFFFVALFFAMASPFP